jgi:hypothetical protein
MFTRIVAEMHLISGLKPGSDDKRAEGNGGKRKIERPRCEEHKSHDDNANPKRNG